MSLFHQPHILGQLGERWASWYLQCYGHRVLARQYRHHHHEIDLITKKRDQLVGVEVKTRRDPSSYHDNINTFLTPKKRRSMTACLQHYQQRHDPHRCLNCRYDLLIVYARWPLKIVWHSNILSIPTYHRD